MQTTYLKDYLAFHVKEIGTTEAQEMFRHFEDIFRNLGLAEFPPIRHEVPSFHPPVWAIPGSDGSEGQAPRDSMLKVPDGPSHETVRVMPFAFSDKWGSLPGPTKPQLKIDTDIDDKVSEGNLDSILKSSGTVKSPSCSQPRQNQYFRSVKIIRKRGPDGRIEETRTVRDGEGNEETVTTQTLGDGSCSVTTHEDKKGDSDTRDRLSEFGEAWMHPQVAPEIPQRIPIWRPEYLPKMEPLMPSAPLKDQEADTLYSKFFGPKPPLQENHWSSSENSNQSFLKRLLRW
ncbi:PREDICTED: HCLS1-associated protein X-1-like isoform X2 [Priapulus caudatus]|uniref:HCLS1-associated protein X-1-like isoform X2 n=1 Tax=Priapulus caudatus TaxID=37621 RepID=A0ABM1EH65_PRICU|nr:PREDICTED: HCLS1-associated protein X-1-like isoform X2 [Priapulus caudatus]